MKLTMDLPQWVHDELSLLPGGKKGNSERLMHLWAKREKKQREADEAKLKGETK